jgi:hypothetical protein
MLHQRKKALVNQALTPVISRIEIPHRSAGTCHIEMCYPFVRSTEALGQ